MSTTLTPPPAAPASPGDAGTPPAPRSGPGVIALLTIIAGGTLLLGTAAWSVIATIGDGQIESGALTAEADGVRSVDVRVEAADLTVRFDDVAEASIDVTGAGGADDWRLRRDGDTLTVSTDRGIFGSWGWWNEPARATLVLPTDLDTVDMRLDLDAGSLSAEGDFGKLEVRVDAGGVDVAGSAESLDLGLAAGSARVDLADVDTASLDVSAGRLTGQLTGSAPRSLDVTMSAGSADLDVPPGSYAITSQTDAGSFTHRLDADESATRTIDVHVSAGSITLGESR